MCSVAVREEILWWTGREMFGHQSLLQEGDTTTAAGQPCVAQQERTRVNCTSQGNSTVLGTILTVQKEKD